MLEEVKIFTDGGSRGNPGHAGIGVVAENNGKVIFEHGAYIGQATNNVAEYKAFIYSLDWVCQQPTLKKVVWSLDSLLVVKQLRGEWKVKNYDISILVNESLQRLKKAQFEYQIKHIPREENSHADALVNQALDRFLQSS